jgi:hypothetical protein
MAHWGIALASGPHINYPLVPPPAGPRRVEWMATTIQAPVGRSRRTIRSSTRTWRVGPDRAGAACDARRADRRKCQRDRRDGDGARRGNGPPGRNFRLWAGRHLRTALVEMSPPAGLRGRRSPPPPGPRSPGGTCGSAWRR